MTKRIFFAAIAAVVFSACEKNHAAIGSLDADIVTLEVGIPVSATKAVNVNEESKVSDYQVFVYSKAEGVLEDYKKIDGTKTSVTMQCTTGEKEIVVLANAPALDSKVSLYSLKETRSMLNENSIGRLVMEGWKTVTLADSSKVDVEVKRMVAKVVLKQVVTAFENEAYNGMGFKILSAYLINVPADKRYLASSTANQSDGPAEWYNKLGYEQDNTYDAVLKDAIGSTATDYAVEHVFYSYPNPYETDSYSESWSERPTRLVVEAELGGKVCYYPVVLPKLQQNAVYDVVLTITRPGKDSPNEDMTKYDEFFTISVSDWDARTSVTETL